MHIAIAGNIGAGKTTLTKLLAKHYKWEAQLEDVVDNPYLDDFYNQMERWSFNLQVYFLNSRFRQVLQIRESGKDIIQDRTIYEDAHIFAPNLHAMGLMTNCVKLIPLGQLSGQRILFELMPLMEKLVQVAKHPNRSKLGLCSIGFDIRAMQHESLYSRLYMS